MENSFEARLSGTSWYFLQHPQVYRVLQETRRALREHARGNTLDLGAGRLTYRRVICECGRDIQYTSLDVDRVHDELDVVADVCRGTGFDNAQFDTVFCSQVLEHVAEPGVFLAEAARVLRPGGRLIMSVPFLFYLHGLPHDYWRFTPAGVEQLARAAGLKVLETRPTGGLVAFLAMLPFTAAMMVLGFLPPALLAPMFITSPVFAALDRLLDTSSRFPAGVLLVAQKP